MKIGIIINTSWNIYNFRSGLINTLLANNHEVITIAPEDKYSEKLIKAGCSFEKIKMDSRGVNPFRDLALFFELYGIYKRIKPDVVLHYTIKPNVYGSLAARFLNIPVINNVCGLGTAFLKNNFISRIAVFLYKIAFRSPQKIFFQNNDDLQFFIKNKIVKERIADLLPGSGINLEKFKPSDNDKPAKPFTFLMISRLIYDKGVLEYFKAAEILRKNGYDCQFQILGPKDPEHQRGIQLDILDNWMNKNFIDYMGTTDDVRPFIDKADCIVLPSYREGTPKTLLEGASYGKPLIATNVPGCINIVEDNYNGFLCSMKDPEDLSVKMKKLISLTDAERKKMGNNSRKKVEMEFDEKIVIRKYLKSISGLKVA